MAGKWHRVTFGLGLALIGTFGCAEEKDDEAAETAPPPSHDEICDSACTSIVDLDCDSSVTPADCRSDCLSNLDHAEENYAACESEFEAFQACVTTKGNASAWACLPASDPIEAPEFSGFGSFTSSACDAERDAAHACLSER